MRAGWCASALRHTQVWALRRPARLGVCLAVLLSLAILPLPTTLKASGPQQPDWLQQFGGAGRDSIDGLATYEGNVYGVGTLGGPSNVSPDWDDVFVRAYDSSGQSLWTAQSSISGDTVGRGIAVDATGIYISGEIDIAVPGQAYAGFWDAFVRKYDFAGNEIWTREFGTDGDDIPWAIAASPSGVFVVGAMDAGGSNASTGFIRVYDVDGNLQWTRQYTDPARSLALDSTSIYTVSDSLITAFTLDGTEKWTQQLGAIGAAIAVSSTSLYVAGYGGGPSPGSGAVIAKYDLDGTQLWRHALDPYGGLDTKAEGLAVDSSGAYLVGTVYWAFLGYTNSGSDDVFIQKESPDGSSMWTRQYGTTDWDGTGAVALGPEGLYFGGFAGGAFPGQVSAGNKDAFVAKLAYPPGSDPTVTKEDGFPGQNVDTFPEGQVATETGTYSDPDSMDDVTLTPSPDIGTITKTGTNSGTWTWSYYVADGTPDSANYQHVTINVDDGHGGVTATGFAMVRPNVAPEGTLVVPQEVNQGDKITVALTDVHDASAVDTQAGFSYRFECPDEQDTGWISTGSVTCTATQTPAQSVIAHVMDKDSGERTYEASVPSADTLPPTGTVVVDPDGSPDGADTTRTTAAQLRITMKDLGRETSCCAAYGYIRLSPDSTTWSSWEQFIPYGPDKAYSLQGLDGPKHVYVQFKDLAGHRSVPVSDTILLDRAGPRIDGPTRSLIARSQLDADPAHDPVTVPVRVRWSTLDGVSGTARYGLEESVDGGAYTPLRTWTKLLGPTSPVPGSYDVNVSPAHSFSVRVGAADGAGNEAVSASSKFSVRVYDDGVPSIIYNRAWRYNAAESTQYYDGYTRYSNSAGDSATFSFSHTGTTPISIGWVTYMGPTRGKARVYVDGVAKRTVDLYSAMSRPRTILATVSQADLSTAVTTHTLKVVVLGSKNTLSTGYRVDVDGFVVVQ